MHLFQQHKTDLETLSHQINTLQNDEYHHSQSFFALVCRKLAQLNLHEINHLESLLKESKSGQSRESAKAPYYFSYNDMYVILLSNEACRKACEDNGYNSWEDIISVFG